MVGADEPSHADAEPDKTFGSAQVLSIERDRGSFRERGSNFSKPSLNFGPVVTNEKGDLSIQVTNINTHPPSLSP